MSENYSSKQRETERAIRKEANRITSIGQQISAPLRGLHDDIVAFVEQIKTNNAAATRCENEYRDRSIGEIRRSTDWFVRLTCASVVVSVITGIILWLQVDITKKQLQIMDNQFHAQRVDQRAWIIINVKPEDAYVNQPFYSEFTITNTGKTLAKHVEVQYSIQILRKDRSPTFNSIPGVQSSMPVLNPQTPHKMKVPMLTKDRADILAPPILPHSCPKQLRRWVIQRCRVPVNRQTHLHPTEGDPT